LRLHVGHRRQHVGAGLQHPAVDRVTDHARGEGVGVHRGEQVRERLPVDEQGHGEQGQQDHLEAPTQVGCHYQAIAHDQHKDEQDNEDLLEQQTQQQLQPADQNRTSISGMDSNQQEYWSKQQEKKETNFENNQRNSTSKDQPPCKNRSKEGKSCHPQTTFLLTPLKKRIYFRIGSYYI